MSTAIYGLVSGFCSFIQFVVYVTFLIVTLTAVRSRRPDASTPLSAGAGILLVDYMLRWTFSMIAPYAMSHGGGGIASYYGVQSMINVVGTLIGALGWGLIMIGTVRVASPPREINLNRAPGDY